MLILWIGAVLVLLIFIDFLMNVQINPIAPLIPSVLIPLGIYMMKNQDMQLLLVIGDGPPQRHIYVVDYVNLTVLPISLISVHLNYVFYQPDISEIL